MSSFAFHSNATFMKLRLADRSRRYAVAGIAWDGAVTNRPGARFGPRAIREASHMLCDGTHPLYDLSPEDRLTDCGDLLLPNTSLEAMREAIEVAPPYDHAELTSNAAANFVWTYLCGQMSRG